MPYDPTAALDDHDRLYLAVRSLILRDSANNGSTYKNIADAAGLSTATVARLFWRQTNRPHLMTLIKLARHYGYEIQLRNRSNQRRVAA